MMPRPAAHPARGARAQARGRGGGRAAGRAAQPLGARRGRGRRRRSVRLAGDARPTDAAAAVVAARPGLDPALDQEGTGAADPARHWPDQWLRWSGEGLRGQAPLHGRAAECAHIDGLLADAREGRSGALVIRGEAGIGKSALIAHARARAADMTVLSVTGNEFDVEVSYAGLYDLLRPTIDVVDQLPDPQRDALQSAFALGSPTTGSRFGVAIGVLGHLSHLAGRGPVLVTVDDGQWLDAASVEALAFVARRVAAEGIVVLIAERSAPGAPSLYGGLPTLTLGGLDDDGVVRAARELGHPADDVGQYRRITAGNPLVIHELVRGGGADHDSDEDPCPRRRPHARRSSRWSRRFASAAAGRSCSWRPRARTTSPVLPAVLAADGLTIADLDEAEANGLLVVDAGRITFRHPLVRSAIYHDAPPAVRRAVHVGFAEALADLTAPAHAERRVAHLAMAGDLPDESLAAEMEQVGHAAAARSSYATAARMLERAALLSTDTDRRARRYLAAAACALPAGRLGDLGRLVEATFAWAGDDATRMAASHLAYRGSLWQGVPDTVDRFLADAALRAGHRPRRCRGDPRRGGVLPR